VKRIFLAALLGLFLTGCGDDIRIVNPSCKKKHCKDKKAEIALAQDTWTIQRVYPLPPLAPVDKHSFPAVTDYLVFGSPAEVRHYLITWENLANLPDGTPYEIKCGLEATGGPPPPVWNPKAAYLRLFSEEPPGQNHAIYGDIDELKNWLKERDDFWHGY